MMERHGDTSLATAAAQVLRADQPPVVAASLGDRTACIDAIERALRARSRRRARAWLITTTVGLAAAAAVVTAWRLSAVPHGHDAGTARLAEASASATQRHAEPSSTAWPDAPFEVSVAEADGTGFQIERGGIERAVAIGDKIAVGARLRSSEGGSLAIALPTGTKLRLLDGAEVGVVELGARQQFFLQQGRLQASVAKLSAGSRFLIETPEVEVEVRGTRFEVNVGAAGSSGPTGCPGAGSTRVTVREGVVVVRRLNAGSSGPFGASETGEVRLRAGDSWPACAKQAVRAPFRAGTERRLSTARSPRALRAKAASSAISRAPTAAGESASPSAVSLRLPPRETPSPGGVMAGGEASSAGSSSLAQQNDLFAAALAARRRGDLREASRWLDRLIDGFPTGPLARTAREQRQRLHAAGVDGAEK